MHDRRADRAGKWMAWALAMAALTGCEPASQLRKFELLVSVQSDPGVPLAGAAVLESGREVGQTSERGELAVTLVGTPGDTVELKVRCPEGYRSDDKPVRAVLRGLAASAPTPRYQVSCPPRMRTAVLAIRAENGPGVPVLYRGREVARTDHDGAAHLVLKAPPETVVALTLDTSGPEHKDLIGGSPELRFTVPARDELSVLEHTFTRRPPKRKRRVVQERPVDLAKFSR